MALRKRASSVFSPASKGGLHVRLFSKDDIPDLVAVAAKRLAPGVTPAVVAKRLNLAFFGAGVCAEGARVELSVGQLQAKCQDIENRARHLLMALGLPSESRDYTREFMSWSDLDGNLLNRSPIAQRFDLTVADIDPLPFPDVLRAAPAPLELADLVREAEMAMEAVERIPLTEAMVPSSIAILALRGPLLIEEIKALAKKLHQDLRKDLVRMESELLVRELLHIAPSAIALLMALAKIAERRARNTGKQSYRRTFRTFLFRGLVAAYFRAFGSLPNATDSERDPTRGPGTKWLDLVLRRASDRPERVTLAGVKGNMLGDDAERERFITEINEVAKIALTTKAKRLGEAARYYR